MTNQVSRNYNYDFLKFVGISCVILAHTGVHGLIFQLRNFDVPLLVLLSGISFAEYSSTNFQSYKEYILKRFIRLVVPTWIFLAFYNIAIFLLFNERPILKTILLQFSLTGDVDTGVGVWIIRIFFSMSIISIFLKKINTNIKTNNIFYLTIALSFAVYEYVEYISFTNLDIDKYILLQYIVFYTVSYGFIFLYGLRMLFFSKKEIKYHIVAFAFIFAIFACYNLIKYNEFIGTQEYKYPPRIYYISYALFISFTLFYLTLYSEYFNFFKKNIIVNFIGKSTMWIYLWHWFFLKLNNNLFFNCNILVKYFFVFTLSTIFTYFQSIFIYFLNKYIVKNINNKKLLIKIFTG